MTARAGSLEDQRRAPPVPFARAFAVRMTLALAVQKLLTPRAFGANLSPTYGQTRHT